MRRLFLSILCLSVFLATTGHAAPIDDARLKALSWLIQNQNDDGSFRGAPGLEVSQTAAAVEGLVNAGLTKGNTYASAVAWLQNYQAYSTDSLSRQITALYKAGRDTSALATQLINWRNDDGTYSWGAYDHYSGSFPDTSLAMSAIKTTGTAYASAGYTMSFIINSQNTDGGWPYYKSDLGTPPSKVIPTVQTLLALNQYKTVYGIQSYINNGVAWLKSQQTSGGGFGEGATGTVLETALAYRALLTELGSSDTAVISAQNYLITQQQSNGSWGSSVDPLLTTLILAAVPAITLPDTNSDGIPDALQTSALLGANPNNTPTGRTFAKGNGLSVASVTTATALPPATLNQPYTTTLAGSSGWALTSGKLPDGLTLNASGQISGTPTTLGSFSFVYQATVSGSVVSTDSQIQVVSSSSTQVPALPGWAMLLMALMLAFIIRHAGKHAISANF
jgi:prenyltransferase beta subunit